jgi:hypothetical protein
VYAGGRARGLLRTRAGRLVKVALRRQVPPCTGGFAIIDTNVLDLNFHFNIIINHDAGNYEGLQERTVKSSSGFCLLL